MSPAPSPHDTRQSHAQGLRGKGSDPGAWTQFFPRSFPWAPVWPSPHGAWMPGHIAPP